MSTRIEKDTMGEMEVPQDAYYGAQSARSLETFAIGWESFPAVFIESFGILKKAAALANNGAGILSDEKTKLICDACDDVISGKLNDHFPKKLIQVSISTLRLNTCIQQALTIYRNANKFCLHTRL